MALAKTGGFTISLKAVDNASTVIDKVNARLQKLHAPVIRMRRSLTKFADLSGLKALGRGFGNLAGMAINAARSIASLIPGLSAITGAASIAGMYALVSSWANFGTQLQQNSQLLGVSTGRLQTMQGAARLLGSDAEALTEGLTTLAHNIQDGIAGRAPEFLRRMTDMGISLTDVNGKARNSAAVFNDVQRVLSRFNDPIIRAKVATELFGGSAGRLLPILSAQTGAWQAAQAEAARYGVTTDGAARKADMLRRAQTGVSLALEGMGQAIATQVGPKIEKVFGDFANWLVRITPDVVALAERFTNWLDRIKWDEIQKGANEFWAKIKALGITMDTVVRATEVFLALWVGSKIAPVLLGIGQITAALVGLGTGPAGLGLAALLAIPAAQAALVKGADVLQGDEPSYDDARNSHPTELGRWLYDNSAFLRAQTNRQMGYATPDRTGQGVAIAAPTGDRAVRENAIYDAAIRQGATPETAAAMTANAMRESGGRTDAVNTEGGGIGAHGLFQQRGSRARMADGRLTSQGSIDEQVAHAMREATEPAQRNGMANGRAIPSNTYAPGTPGSEGYAFGYGFERHNTGANASDAQRHAENAARAAEAERIAQRQRLRLQAAPPPPTTGNVEAVTRPQQQSSLTGSARLEVAFANAPPGTTARATTSGGIFGDAPNISMGMPSYASA